MPFDAQIPLAATAPPPVSPIATIGSLMQARDAISQIALRNAQTQQAQQQTQNIAAEAQVKNRALADQNTIQEIERSDPNSYAKIRGGDFSPLVGKVQDSTLQTLRASVNAELANESTRGTAELTRRKAAADAIGKDFGTAMADSRTPDGAFDSVKASQRLSQLYASHQTELATLGIDPSTLPQSIADEDHAKLLASRIGSYSSMTEAAQNLAKEKAALLQTQAETAAKQQEAATGLATAEKNRADAAKALADRDTLVAGLPKAQADAAIAKFNSEFAADHGGLTPDQAATTTETARHNKAEETVQRGELGIKQKTFEATLGSGLDANGQPLAPEALKAAAMQDPTALAIAHYQLAPPPAQTRGGVPSPILRKVLAINPQYDATTYPARSETARGFSPSGPQGQAITAADTALAHLNTLSAAGAAMKNGDIQAINRIANAVGAQVGATPKATYDTILNMVGPEISKAVIGAAGGEGERVATAANFKSELSDAQRESNIGAAVGLLGARYDKAAHAYEQQMGVPLPRTLSPESQSIRQKYTSAPGGAGGHVIQIGAKKYQYKGSGDTADLANYSEVK